MGLMRGAPVFADILFCPASAQICGIGSAACGDFGG
jgi:hypothetical protein